MNPESTHLYIPIMDQLLSWTISQEKRGFDISMHSAILQAWHEDPYLISKFINTYAKARSIEQNPDNLPTLFYPLESAMRFVANKYKVFDDSENHLTTLESESWNSDRVILMFSEFSNEVIETAATRTMAKNLPHRAAFLLWLLGQDSELYSQLNNHPWNIIELGASSGLLTTAMCDIEGFIEWTKNQQSMIYANNLMHSIKLPIPSKIRGVGIDMAPSEDDWTLACIDRDNLREETKEFINIFSDARKPIIKGNAEQFVELPEVETFLDESEPDAITIIIISMFLYQLPKPVLDELRLTLKNFISKQNSIVLIADSKRIFNPQIPGWLAWIENSQGKVGPTIELKEEPELQWILVEDDKYISFLSDNI